MGDRYILTVVCPRCDFEDDDVPYAPTCGFAIYKCSRCGLIIDLEEYTGISYEDCSNAEEIKDIVDKYKDELDEY